MACATLKRSLDWESLNQRPPKRRRCSPFSTAQAQSQPGASKLTVEPTPSAFNDASCTKLTPGKILLLFPSAASISNTVSVQIAQIVRFVFFFFCPQIQMSDKYTFCLFLVCFRTEKMAQNIREEITRLHRRKHLTFTYNSALERMQDSESSGSEMGPDSPRRPDTPPNVVRNPEKGLFTFKQVSNRARQDTFCMDLSTCHRINIDLFGYVPFIAGSNDLRANVEGARGQPT